MNAENSALSQSPAAQAPVRELFAEVSRVVQEHNHGTGEDLARTAIEWFAGQAEESARAKLSSLGDIALRAEQVRRAEAELDEAVAAAREQGVIWAAIAEASGMVLDGAAARRRWDPNARAKHRADQRQRMQQLRARALDPIQDSPDG